MVQRRPSDYEGKRGWQGRVALQTAVGACLGLIGGAAVAAVRGKQAGGHTFAISFNAALASACLAGAQEAIREIRFAAPDDLVNSLIGGFAVGGLAGRYNGGPSAAWPAGFLTALFGSSIHFISNEIREFRLRQVAAQLRLSETENVSDLATSDRVGREDSSVWRVLESSETTNRGDKGLLYSRDGEGKDARERDERKGSRDGEIKENVTKIGSESRNAWVWPEWMPIRPAKLATKDSVDVSETNNANSRDGVLKSVNLNVNERTP